MTISLTDENFDKETASADKLVLVDFFATWCEPCSMLTPVLEKVAEQFKEKVVLMKANLDNNQFHAQKFGVDKIPTIVLFKNNKPVNGFIGLLPENSIKDWLENAIKDNSK